MDFLELQKDLKLLTWDNRIDWLPDEAGDNSKWEKNKAAINAGIKSVYSRLKQNSDYQNKNYLEVNLSIVDNKVSFPIDFDIAVGVIYYDEEYFDFEIQKASSKLIFPNITSWDITLRYLPVEVTLTTISSEPVMDSYFHEAIASFAMEKYHLAQFDWDNVAKSVAYAEEKLEDLINKYN